MNAKQSVVYRAYDANGRLLYIGASSNIEGRLHNHRTQSWWYSLMTRVDTEPHPTMQAAFAAEAVAIQEEQPAFNRNHTGRRGAPRMTDADVRVMRDWALYSSKTYDKTGALPVYLRRFVRVRAA